MMPDARDVIARAIRETSPMSGADYMSDVAKGHLSGITAHEILAALHDAGFVVAQLDDVAQTVWFYDHQWGDGVHERLSELIGDYDPRSSGKDQP